MNTSLTPKKIAVLKRLARGEPAGAGRPTKQALVRDGLAAYVPDSDPLLNPWDREVAITARGRQVIR